jgi:hypothetical protein
MNSSLLSIVDYPSKTRPVMMDKVPVSPDPEAGPFLITSTKSLVWIEKAFGGGFLRVAVRQVGAGALFRELVESIAQKGEEREWGNILPPTEVGIKDGIEYLRYFELPNLVLLYGEDFDISIAGDIDRVPADWLPNSWAVIVPSREYVGTAYLFQDGHVGAVLHNPSRGVVILKE